MCYCEDDFIDMTSSTCEYPVEEDNADRVFINHDWKFSGGYDYLTPHGTIKSVFIKKVLYNDPVTIVFWSDDTKTTSKINADDVYSQESGLLLCIMKKICGATNIRNLLHEWVPLNSNDTKDTWVTTADVRRRIAVGLNKHTSNISAEDAINLLNNTEPTKVDMKPILDNSECHFVTENEMEQRYVKTSN